MDSGCIYTSHMLNESVLAPLLCAVEALTGYFPEFNLKIQSVLEAHSQTSYRFTMFNLLFVARLDYADLKQRFFSGSNLSSLSFKSER